MGTYMGAYSNRPTDHYPSKEKSIIVKEAECLDYYHYHGSWGEWTWKLIDQDGVEHEVDTWSDYEVKKLVDKKVVIKNGIFSLA